MPWPEVSLLDTFTSFVNSVYHMGLKESWVQMAEKTASYAVAIASFCNTINDNKDVIDTGNLQTARDAAQIITDITSMSWPEVGLIDPIINLINALWNDGEDMPNTWDSMKENVMARAEAIVGFCDTLGSDDFTYDETAITNAKTVAGTISDIMSYEWPSISLESLFIDFVNKVLGLDIDDSWDDLPDKAGSLASAITTFSTSLGDSIITTDEADGAKSAAETIAYILALNWPTEGGIGNFFKTLFEGEIKWEDIEAKLPTVGSAITAFADSISGITQNDIQNAEIAAGIITSLTTMAGEFDWSGQDPRLMGLTQWFDTLSQEIVDFLDDIANSFSDENKIALIESISTLVDDMMTALNPTGDKTFDSTGTEAIEGYSSGVEDGTLEAVTASGNVTDAVLDKMDVPDQFKNTSILNMQGLSSGMLGRMVYLCGIALSIASSIANSFDNYEAFYQSGRYMIDGVIAGMNSRIDKLEAVARYAARAAKTAYDIEAQIQSPSKVMAESGRYMILGVAEGILDNLHYAEDAAEYSAQQTVSIMSDVLSHLNTDDLDAAPVIRPVLDMTDIQNGARTIDDMLHIQGVVGLDNSVTASLARDFNKMASLGESSLYDDSKVLVAIESLGSKLDTLGDAISGMGVSVNGKRLVGSIVNDMYDALSDLEKSYKRGVM